MIMINQLGIATFQNVKGPGHGRFEFQFNQGLWETTDITDTPQALAVCPRSGFVTRFQMEIRGAAHHTALPIQPQFSFQSIGINGDVQTHAHAQDMQTRLIDYEFWHLLSADVAVQLSSSRDYWIEVYGEFGANALLGQQFRNVSYSMMLSI